MLTEKDIKRGTFIWYRGTTSRLEWDCPAVIAEIDHQQKLFWVRSLDDMKVQGSEYEFEVHEHSPNSRRSMRLASVDETNDFMDKRERILKHRIENAEMELRMAKRAFANFTEHRKALPLLSLLE